MSCDDIRAALATMNACEETPEGSRIVTHCLTLRLSRSTSMCLDWGKVIGCTMAAVLFKRHGCTGEIGLLRHAHFLQKARNFT